jgi:ferric-dicitrate binding protein FerR (iron transport regulator)
MARAIAGALSLILALGIHATLAAGPARAQAALAGVTQNAIGTLVVVRSDGIEDRLRGKGVLQLFEGDVLRTDPGSQGVIELREGIVVALNENTVAKLLSRWEKGKPLTRIVRLQEGEIFVKTVDGPKVFEVETPVATAIVKETEFNMKVQPGGETVLTVIQGIVEFGTAFGTCPIRTSTVSYGIRGKRCTRPEVVDTTAVLRWSRQVLQ